MNRYFELAREIASATDENDTRSYLLGVCALRSDGALIRARNGSIASSPSHPYRVIPESHAEVRACSRLDQGGEMWVARVRRKDQALGLAKPCAICQLFIARHRLKRVYWTIDDFTYGVAEDCEFDHESIFRF